MKQDDSISIPRKELIERFAKEINTLKSIEKICDGDSMLIPISELPNWTHDMGVILGTVIVEMLKERE